MDLARRHRRRPAELAADRLRLHLEGPDRSRRWVADVMPAEDGPIAVLVVACRDLQAAYHHAGLLYTWEGYPVLFRRQEPAR